MTDPGSREHALQAPAVSGDALAEVEARIAAGRGVHRRLPGLGFLHIERPLPFLAVGSDRFVTTLPAHLLVDAAAPRPKLEAAARRLGACLAASAGGALLLELRVSERGAGQAAASEAPRFRIRTSAAGELGESLDALRAALAEIRIPGCGPAVVSIEASAPPGMLATGVERLFSVVLELDPIHQGPDGVAVYPLIFQELRRQLDRALRDALVVFARRFAKVVPVHAQAFARRRLLKTARDVDRRLTVVSNALRYLYLVTPTNSDQAFHEFTAGGCERAPRFEYRPIDFGPQLLKREIYAIPLERVEDPALIAIFREKQAELDRLVTLLVDRNTERFRWGSLQLFGGVDAPLARLAERILEHTAAASGEDEPGAPIAAELFADLARRELDYYCESWPELAPQIVLRDDVPGLLVVNGALVIGKSLGLTSERARALIEHEIGTHLLTFYNGNAQRLHHLGSGLAGYEALQEGLAVLAEYLVGGLTPTRLRLLAARVLAVASMTNGGGFVDTYRTLKARVRLGPRAAFMVAMRVHRGGGLSKDAIYLRGLEQVLDYLGAAGEIDDLLVGKVSMEQLPLIRDLRLRGVIRPPRLRPRWLTDPAARARLSWLARGAGVLDLLKGDPCELPSS